MLKKAYMGIDMRADHKFVIPRPDYTLKYGVPNSCTNCHGDKSKIEMDKLFRTKFNNLKTKDSLLEIIGEIQKGNFKNKNELLGFIKDSNNAQMRRAYAISFLREFPSMKAQDYNSLLSDSSVLVVQATLELLANFPDIKQLQDSVLKLTSHKYKTISYSTDSMLKLASLSRFGYVAKSPAKFYEDSVKRFPYFLPAYVNLADLHRQVGNEAQSLQILKDAFSKNPQDASLLVALGMYHIRIRDYHMAIDLFDSASKYEPENPYFRYLYILTYKELYGAKKACSQAKLYESKYEGSFLFNQLLFALSVELQDVENVKFYFSKINKFRQ